MNEDRKKYTCDEIYEALQGFQVSLSPYTKTGAMDQWFGMTPDEIMKERTKAMNYVPKINAGKNDMVEEFIKSRKEVMDKMKAKSMEVFSNKMLNKLALSKEEVNKIMSKDDNEVPNSIEEMVNDKDYVHIISAKDMASITSTCRAKIRRETIIKVKNEIERCAKCGSYNAAVLIPGLDATLRDDIAGLFSRSGYTVKYNTGDADHLIVSWIGSIASIVEDE